jgi:hypothetical protein
VHFAARRGGYRGGVSLQRYLYPLHYLRLVTHPPGWSEAPPAEPAWWRGANEDMAQPSAFAEVSLPPPPPRRRTVPRQADLFVGETRTEAPQKPHARAEVEVGWLDALFASETYSAQRRLAGRVAPSNELVRSLLVALVARGGRMTRAGLAQALDMPSFRLGGLVSATWRVLNVDQAQIPRDDGDDIILDEGLIRTQFALRGDQGLARRGGPRSSMRRVAERCRARASMPLQSAWSASRRPLTQTSLPSPAGGESLRPSAESMAPGRRSWRAGSRSGRERRALQPQKSKSTKRKPRFTAARPYTAASLSASLPRDTPEGALRPTVDAWFYTLEEDVLAEGRVDANDTEALAASTEALMERRLAAIARTAPAFSAVLRAYRRAQRRCALGGPHRLARRSA